jgi:hypothetical protein
MTETTKGPIFSVITTERIKSQRARWVTEAEGVRNRLIALAEESERLNRQLLALDGACQAADEFVKIADNEDTLTKTT